MSVAVRSLYERWWRGGLRDLEDLWEDMLDVLDVSVRKICFMKYLYFESASCCFVL